MQQPKVILADEPIASLDPLNAKVVMDSLRDINVRDGITVITNLHTLDTARTYCNRIIGMAAGKVVFDGPPGRPDREAVRAIYGADSDGGEISEAITSTSIGPPSRRCAIQPPALWTAALARLLKPTAIVARVKGTSPAKPPADAGPTGETTMFRKALLGAVALAALATGAMAHAEDLKEFRIGILGGENEADRLRNYQCLADQLQDRCSASRRSRCSRPPTMTASSRACSAARSTIAELGASGYAKIYLENTDAVEPILTTVQTDGSTGYYSIMVWPARIPASPSSKPMQGQEARLCRSGLDLGLSHPADVAAEGSPACRSRNTSPRPASAAAMRTSSSKCSTATSMPARPSASGVGDFKDGYTSGNLQQDGRQGHPRHGRPGRSSGSRR